MKLLLVPASTETVNQSILGSIDLEVAGEDLKQTEFEQLSKRLQGDQKFNCWALSEGKRSVFQQIEPDDRVLITTKGTGLFEYYATIYHKVESEKLGRSIGWRYVPGKPWNLIYFLRNIKKREINKEKMVEFLGYKKIFPVYGTTIVSPERLARPLSNHESLDDFVEHFPRDSAETAGWPIRRAQPSSLAYRP